MLERRYLRINGRAEEPCSGGALSETVRPLEVEMMIHVREEA
jgi:hypothetical protein